MSDLGRMFIGGEWVEAMGGRIREVVDPFDGGVIAEVADGGREESRRAVAAAREAFDRGTWPGTPGEERGELLERLGELVEENMEELALLETRDTGKTLEESRWDMDDVASIFRYYGELAFEEDDEEENFSPFRDSTSLLLWEPVGVCGQILPWNYPLLQASWKVAPALAAGCTMVVKPSEITPLCTIRLMELIEEVGVPPGVVNLVLGPGATAGAELAENHDVDLISFTGGGQTGRRIMRAAAGNVKRVALELGGKNPHIVFADGDLDQALEGVLNGAFFHAGQICSAGSRLMVEESVAGEFVDRLEERIRKIHLGKGTWEDTEMGPLISREHLEKVQHHIALAREEGAILRCGGGPPEREELAKGFFLEPTLFTGCHDGMTLVKEEVFGPVISVETFTSEEEVLRRANDTPYGLAAGFWSRDRKRIDRVSRALRFGTVWVNAFNVYFPQAPWGGYRQSGLGRELGVQGLEEYLEVKHLFESHCSRVLKFFGTEGEGGEPDDEEWG